MARLILPLLILGAGAYYAHREGLVDFSKFGWLDVSAWAVSGAEGTRTTVQPSTPPTGPETVAPASLSTNSPPPWAPSPSLEQQLIWDNWDEVAGWSRANPNWTAAMMRRESQGQLRAVSAAGALGAMQVMPPTARQMYNSGYTKYEPTREVLFTIEGALYFGTAYLEYLSEFRQAQGPNGRD